MYVKLFLCIFLITTSSCHNGNMDGDCNPQPFLPNEYKFYLPYSQSDKILFSNDNSEIDTVLIQSKTIEPGKYGRIDCFRESESVNIDFIFKQHQSESCLIKFRSELHLNAPYLVVSSDNCIFQATFEIINSGNGVITQIPNFTFQNQVYEEVIQIAIESNDSDIQEIVLAKNIGFVYIKVNENFSIPI